MDEAFVREFRVVDVQNLPRASLLSGLYHQQTRSLKENNHVTIAEVLRAAGYTTLMSGKWHVANTPPERGFDRYFGFLSGAVNFFTGADYATGQNLMRLDDKVFEVPSSGFYTTDAFTDYAIDFLDEASRKDKPFFLYLAHNAPHFPLHALPQDIAKYRGKYLKGWDVLRAERYARMVRMGAIGPNWGLSPRDAIVPAWDGLSHGEKQEEDLLMAVYAAMVDRLDQNIGRLLAHLDKLGATENTVVIFLSDNGACPYDFNDTPNLPPGPDESYRTYNSPWANAGNTPFRLHKQWSHEGGAPRKCFSLAHSHPLRPLLVQHTANSTISPVLSIACSGILAVTAASWRFLEQRRLLRVVRHSHTFFESAMMMSTGDSGKTTWSWCHKNRLQFRRFV
jgi:arylsulfatase